MNQTEIQKSSKTESIRLITFRCGSLLIGLELTDVQEINRINTLAGVPEAPRGVCGVINLRGEVVTMIDLREVLDQSGVDATNISHHNVFVRNESEVIGLVTDGVSDIVTIDQDAIDPPPSNLKGTESVLFKGVHTFDSGQLMVILDLDQVLSTVMESAT